MYLKEAKKLLNAEYKKRYKENISGFHIEVMDEKIKHSYQVLGAGNFILRHEPCFAGCKPEEIDKLQAMVLLHDIGRFYEILIMGEGKRLDHGVYGAEMLSETADFSSKDITIPIRHHGHLIEELYADEEYKNLSVLEQKLIERNSFLVRDADKLANFYLLVRNFDEYGPMFLAASEYKDPYNKNISERVNKDFFGHKCVTRGDVCNLADKALCLWSWFYDVNYDSSFLFIQRLHILERFFACLSKYWKEEEAKSYWLEMEKFVENRYKKSS